MCDFHRVTRSLIIPPHFVPYMEKHKLYEFFYELVTQLLIQQPEDPVVFMKQCIQHIIRKRDIPRVILIAPPCFDKMALAKILQKEVGIRPVTLEELCILSPDNSTSQSCSDDVSMRMKKMLTSGILHESGWVLVDIPGSKAEARALQRVGVIPTHVIQIIPNVEDEIQKKITIFDLVLYKLHSLPEDAKQLDYKRTLRGLREAYANLLIEVETGARTIQELGKDCAALTKIRKHYGAPSLFRIVLIGSRGSGRRSLAKYISERFNLVYVDFNCILKQACSQELALGEILRSREHKCANKLQLKAKIKILEKYLLEFECLKKGWIIIRYPITVDDFKLLDMISTPPNRVIILKVDTQTCKERLLNRRYNVITGSEHNLISSNSSIVDLDSKLIIHPKDQKNIIEQDLQEYEENIESIMQYAGETASVIDATCMQKFVKEKLEACLMRPIPSAKPRIPQPCSKIDPMDIEFDPDDEPDPSIFDNIRASEHKFSFI